MLLTFDVSLNMPSHIWHINPDKVSPFNKINDSINKMKNSSVVADPLGGKKKDKKELSQQGVNTRSATTHSRHLV